MADDRTHRRLSNAALALAAVALFVALGGPAYAAKVVKKTIDGKTIKAKSITGKQLADGAVDLAKLDKGARATVPGPAGAAGPKGPAGARGANGTTGGRGTAGGFDVVDARGRRVGAYGGFYQSYLLVTNDEGAAFMYDPESLDDDPTLAGPPFLYYKGAGCTGTSYTNLVSATPTNLAILVEAPPSAGDTAYLATAAPVESFTTESMQTPSGCVPSVQPIAQAVPVREAGEVPSVKKPLVLVPRQ